MSVNNKMPIASKQLNFAGPTKRKTLNSVRDPTEDAGADNDVTCDRIGSDDPTSYTWISEDSSDDEPLGRECTSIIGNYFDSMGSGSQNRKKINIVLKSSCDGVVDNSVYDKIDSDDPSSYARISEDTTDVEPLCSEYTYSKDNYSDRMDSFGKTQQLKLPEMPHKHEGIIDKMSPENQNYHKYGTVLVIVIVVMPIVCGLVSTNWYKQYASEEIPEACEKFYTLEKSYTNVDDTLWDSLYVGFRRATALRQRREPGTFLFLHNGATDMIDGFIHNVTNITVNCFGGAEAILLDSKHFKRPEIMHDYGVFLSQQRSALQKQGVMVVRNLEDIPPKAAQAFHSICDTEEPLVERAIIYLTMDISIISGNVPHDRESATANAENLLHLMWKEVLDPEILDPLITRLTENVYRII